VSDRTYLALIDRKTSGNRCDVTPLFADYVAFSALVEPLAFEVVVGIDALGFILGAVLALRTHVGFVPVRKGGKLPGAVDSAECVDYTGQPKTLELRRDALEPGTRVLLVDEWIETGVQVGAASSRASPACTSTTTNGRSRCGRATDVFRPRRICRCYNQAALQ